MTDSPVDLERRDRVATVTIQRPTKLNALNQTVIDALTEAFSEFAEPGRAETGEIRAVVLTGSGEKAFVAGADIAEIQALSTLAARRFAALGQRLMRTIETLPVPVIAAINGYALGGGLELAMACHLRFAATTAQLGLPESKLGLMPGFGGTQRLARLIGRGNALELMLTGSPVSAQRALELGLVQRVFEPDELLEQSLEMAEKLASGAPLATAAILETVDRGLDLPLDHALALETMQFGQLCASNDMREGTAAFLAKRKPAFTGQ